LAAEQPAIAGLIPMAPAIKVRNRLLPLAPALRHLLAYNPLGGIGDEDLGDPAGIDRIWCYDEMPMWGAGEVYRLQQQVRQALPHIRQPILIFYGRRDAQVPPEAAQMLHDGVASTDRKLVVLENSGHNLLVDGERESVWAQSYDWMMGVVRDK
jgi:carboxylesterase